jgi:GH35 family endo-1,4-beta-xylanase
MKERADSRHSYPHQSTESFDSTRRCGVVVVLLICIIGLLAMDLSAQPLASRKSKFVGNIIRNGNSIRSNFSKYWNQVTAENAGKWGSVEFSRGSYSWTQLDNIYNYALANGFPYRHHNLIWGQQ